MFGVSLNELGWILFALSLVIGSAFAFWRRPIGSRANTFGRHSDLLHRLSLFVETECAKGPKDLCRLMADEIRESLKVPYFAIYSVADSEATLECVATSFRVEHGMEVEAQHAFASHLAAESHAAGAPVARPWSPRGKDQVRGKRSGVAVPFRVGGRVEGVVVLGGGRAKAGGGSEELLSALAAQIAAGWNACHRLEEESGRTRQLAIVNQIGKVAASKRSPADLLETTVQLLTQRFGYDHVCFALLAPLGGDVLSWAESGKKPGFFLKGKEAFRRAGSPFSRAATTGATVVHENVRDAESFVDLRGGHTKSEIAVPILSAGEVIAVLNVASSTPEVLTHEDASALEGIRGWLAIAITNSLYLEELNRANQEALWARELAEEQRRRLEITLRSVPEGVIVLDSQKRVILLNQRVEELLNCDEEAVLGRPILDELKVERLRLLLDEAFDSPGQVVRGEIEIPKEGESSRFVHVCIDTELHNSEVETGTLMILRDITRERRLRALKSEFLANVSHELRTPLTSVIGFSQLLADEELGEINEVQRECVERITNQGRHLLNIINALLDLSRLKAKKTSLELVSASMQEIIEETIANLSSLSQDKSIKVTSIYDDNLPPVRVDCGKISQVLINLLNNAIKFTPVSGEVEVEAWSDDSFVEVAVTDTGPGIPPEHLDYIFDRFHRVGSVPGGTAAGTGLGLTIVKELVELHEGGRVSVESRLGVGSRFSFRVAAEPWPVRNGPLRVGYLPLKGHKRVARAAIDSTSDHRRVEVKSYRGVVDLALEFRRGRIDAAVLPMPEGIRLASGGAEAVCIAIVHREDSSLLTRKLGSVSELRGGVVVGVPGLGSNEQILLHQVLLEADLDPLGVTLATVRWEEAESRLEAGTLDAVVLPEPFAGRARERGALVLATMSEILPGFPCSALFVRRDLLQSRGDLIQKFVEHFVSLALQDEVGVVKKDFLIDPSTVTEVMDRLGSMGQLSGRRPDPERLIDVRAFAEGSRVEACTEPGKGRRHGSLLKTTPCSSEGSPTSEVGRESVSSPVEPSPFGKRVVLVADDRPEVLSLITVKFRREFEVLTASNGREAVMIARAKPRPDLILMDMMMPEMDGLEATRILKADHSTRDIPIWAFTARVMSEDLEEARAAGCSDVVSKPFEPKKILERVRQLFADQESESGSRPDGNATNLATKNDDKEPREPGKDRGRKGFGQEELA